MQDNYFEIPFKLPSLNDYVDKCRANAYMGAKFKKRTEEMILLSIYSALHEKTLKRVILPPIELFIEWHEKDKRRDVDNIKSAVKFILDAMTKAGIIKDDGRKYISQIYDKIINDKETKVIVRIKEGK